MIPVMEKPRVPSKVPCSQVFFLVRNIFLFFACLFGWFLSELSDLEKYQKVEE